MRVKMIIISTLFSLVISIFLSFVYISYEYSKANQFDFTENVQRVQVTSIIPTVLNNKTKIVEGLLDVYKGSKTTILFIPYDSNGIQLLIIGKGNEESFHTIKSNFSNDFFLVNQDSFFARNIEIYGIDRTAITGYFTRSALPGVDYIADYKGYGNSVEGEYLVESSCAECATMFLSVFPPNTYQISRLPINRNFIESFMGNPASTLMFFAIISISIVFYLYINHLLILERRRIGIHRVYGGTRSEIARSYLLEFYILELSSVIIGNIVFYFILRQLLSKDDALIVHATSMAIGSSLMMMISVLSVLIFVNSKDKILWK